MTAGLNYFLSRPTRERWERELAGGWPGPDGSSSSTDTICGVRIGITSTDFEHVDLPANRHDWYYQLGRRLRLPESYRAAADAVYRDLCIERCRHALTGARAVLFPIAWTRAWTRYVALRAGARFAWTESAKCRDAAWYDEREAA